MKYLDWQMIVFVGVSVLHDCWITWGLPQVYYWDLKQKNLEKIKNNKADNDKAA